MVFETVEVFLRVIFAGLAGILAFLTLAAYSRIRNSKLLLVGFAFLLFGAKGAILVAGIFSSAAYDLLPTTLPGLLLDFAIVAMLYSATIKG